MKSDDLKEMLTWRYAHRGYHDKPFIPENSVHAIERAVERGFGIEFDVHLTKDKKLAVIHDSSLKRTCSVDVRIEDIDFAEAHKYALEESDERIPLFQDVLKAVGGRIPMIIELKVVDGNQRELTDSVVKALEGYDGLYCIESFNPLAVSYMRKAHPNIIRGQLAGCLNKESKTLSFWQDFLLKNLLVNISGKPDFVAIRFEDRNQGAFRRFKGAKFYWTIRRDENLREIEAQGAAGIFEQFLPEKRQPLCRTSQG